MNDSRRRTIFIAFLLTLLLHIPLIILFVKTINSPLPVLKPNKNMKLHLVHTEKIKKNKKIHGQIVSLPKPRKEKIPKKSQYLSQYNSKVKHQQKAITHKSTGRKKAVRHKKKKHKTEQIKKKRVTSKKKTKKSILFKKQKKSFLVQSENPGQLYQNIEQFNQVDPAALSGAGSDDALLKIKNTGAVTLLNSRKFKYWDFFNRVKKEVKKHWHPDKVYTQRDPNGNIYALRNRLTVLKIILGKDGDIEKIVLLKKSGLKFLDQEATNAFELAASFPNPPKGLFDENGKIKFNFGFYFEMHAPASNGFWR